MYDHNLNKVVPQVSISPDQLAENFEKNRQEHAPPILRQSPNEWSEEICVESVSYLKNPLDTLKALCKMIASEYFHHPVIRAYLKNICFEKTYLKTKPTKKGKKSLDVYSYYYPTKRITGRRINQIKPELWMLCLESEKKGFITIDFVMGHERDKNWNDLKKKLEKMININREVKGSNERKLVENWNSVRSRICENLIKHFAKPNFEKEIKKFLTDKGKKVIIQNAKNELKSLINNKPYKPKKNLENEEITENERDVEIDQNDPKMFNQLMGLTAPRVLAVTMTSNINTHSKNTEAVIVSLDELGEIDGVLRLKNCFRKTMNQRNKSLVAIYEKNMERLKEFINEKKPKVIILSPKSLLMQGLKIQLHDLSSDVCEGESNEDKPFVMWGDNRISEIFSRSEVSKEYINHFDQTVREAVSLGRYVQDPLSETLNLWSFRQNDNLILKLALDPMQHLIPLKELHDELETIILEIVGNIGVNINRCYKLKHRSSPLQFVAGLGPRKSDSLIKNLNQNFKDGFVGGRSDLNDCGLLSDKTYELCIGFLRFYNEDIKLTERILKFGVTPLDLTRIHPNNEDRAIKIVLESLQVDYDRKNKPKNYSNEFLRIMKDIAPLKELDLINYGEHLSQKKHCNMHWQIQFIERELEFPFQDSREEFKTSIRNQELFYKLTNENKYVLYENSLILMQIKSNDIKGIKLSTNNNVQAFIVLEDFINQLDDPKIDESNLAEKFPINSYTQVRIRKIDYEKQKLNVTLNETALNSHNDFLRNSKCLEKWGLDDNSFKVYKDEDYPKTTVQKKMKQAIKFTPRSIRHPYFKNLPWIMAENYLKNRPQGDFIIRPSSQGNNYLNITWKIFDKIYSHMIIKEGHKSENEELSKQLFLNSEKEPFDSLDDIIESYIKPVNSLIQRSMLNSKFNSDNIEKVKDKVKTAKKEAPNRIPYFFSTSQFYSDCFILTYILNKLKVVHEIINIKSDGLIFHDQKFFNIEDLLGFFRKNLKTPEYSKFLQNTTPPSFSKKKHELGNENRSKYKQEDKYGVKMEERDKHYGKRSYRKRSASPDSYEYKQKRRENYGRNYNNQPRYRGDYYKNSSIKQEYKNDFNDRKKVKIEERSYTNKRNFSQYENQRLKGANDQPMNAMYSQPPTQFVSNYSQNIINLGYQQGMGGQMSNQFSQNSYLMNQNLNALSAQMNPFGAIPPPPPTKSNQQSDKKN